MTDTSNESLATDRDDDQYSLIKILTIWAAVTVPMPILAFVVAPAMAEEGTMRFAFTFWFLMIAGMAWQFMVSMFVLAREGSLRSWAVFKKRVWVNVPRDPKTGEPKLRLFWWLIPAFLFYAAIELTPVGPFLGNLILFPFPFVANLAAMDLEMIAVPELVGAWWVMGVAIVASIFNYALGEELLFRGVPCPKCEVCSGSGTGWSTRCCSGSIICTFRPGSCTPSPGGWLGRSPPATSAQTGSP